MQILWCCTCKLATRLPSGVCSPGTDELLQVFLWMRVSCRFYVWVDVWCGYIHKAADAINTPSPVNLKSLAGFTAWLTSGSEKKKKNTHSHRVSVCSSLKPQISDLYLLRNPSIVWLFLKSFSFIWQPAEKGSHRKKVASGWRRNLSSTVNPTRWECSRQRFTLFTGTKSWLPYTWFTGQMKCVSTVLIGL